MEEGLDWSATPLPHEQHTWQRPHNKAVSVLLTLRGSWAATADTCSFMDPALFPSWQVRPTNASLSTELLAVLLLAAAVHRTFSWHAVVLSAVHQAACGR